MRLPRQSELDRFSCGSSTPDKKLYGDRFEKLKNDGRVGSGFSQADATVDTIFHVIAVNETVEGGNIPVGLASLHP